LVEQIKAIDNRRLQRKLGALPIRISRAPA